MYGSHVGTLSVTLRQTGSVFSLQRWTSTGGKGYEWYHAQVNLQSSTLTAKDFSVCLIK